MATEEKLHVETPLIESTPMSKLAGFKVYLKLENTQPTGSFKVRGIGNLIQQEMKRGCKRLVASSGGNAGISAAYCARQLGVPITVYVPESTPEFTRQIIQDQNAQVVVHGKVWNHANQRALEDAQNPDVAFIHPYDNPEIWTGHASCVEELSRQMRFKPDLVVLSVGGGGLMCGIVQGMDEVGWGDVPLLAMETVGADCFNQAVRAGKLVTLPDITSVAKCLGALSVADKAYEYYKKRKVLSEVITDPECIESTVKFVDDHRMLVEPACGAALGSVYNGVIHRLQKAGQLGDISNVVIIVCGGQSVSMAELDKWQKEFLS